MCEFRLLIALPIVSHQYLLNGVVSKGLAFFHDATHPKSRKYLVAIMLPNLQYLSNFIHDAFSDLNLFSHTVKEFKALETSRVRFLSGQ